MAQSRAQMAVGTDREDGPVSAPISCQNCYWWARLDRDPEYGHCGHPLVDEPESHEDFSCDYFEQHVEE